MFKIAIVGASTLLGRELKESLADSPLAVADINLFDGEESRGQLDQIGDEITFVQEIEDDSFENIDFTFFCGSPELTLKHLRTALRSGTTVLDLSGALDQQEGVLTAAPWLTPITPDLFTAAVAPAHPAALALALLFNRLQSAVKLHSAATTLLLPASEFGQAAMDELHQQTLSLLSFKDMPREVFDAQTAFNVLSGFGESAKAKLTAAETRIRRNFAALLPATVPTLAVQAVQAPVFHGLVFSVAVELAEPVELRTLEEALSGEHIDLVLEDTDSPSNLAATGQDDVLVRLKAERNGEAQGRVSRFWLWAATDNLRLSAQNAVACALELRLLRPKGKVQ